ncbi:MAG: PaaI family thioesterase [Gammaproteobacteria bacterium]|nr:PaaI family thioesterase [Gammaproteobacteria bacterium]
MNIDYTKLMKAVIPTIRHCEVLGIKTEEAREGYLKMQMPWHEKLVGDTDHGVIHGGALTTLLDTTCGFASASALDPWGLAPTLDLRIDYMRPATQGKAIYAVAEVYRKTPNVIFTRGTAFHEGEEDLPIAHCTATFMQLDHAVSDGLKAWLKDFEVEKVS